MDDTEDDARYPPNPYGGNHHQGYGSSHRQKLPVQSGPYSRPVGDQYVDEDDEEEDEDDELGEEEDDNDNGQNNGYPPVDKNVGDDEDNDDDDVEEEHEDEEDDENDEAEDEDHDKRQGYGRKNDDEDLQRHPKKRKLISLVSSYEFAPRVPSAPPSAATASTARVSFGGRSSLTDWTERETFVLLDAWGERFLQRGKKSLRSEEWQEVAEKVSEVSKIDRTDTQCRNRLDTLKKKYKKEKANSSMGGTSKWSYFKKMDLLLSTANQQPGLSCGMDSGEYVFMNPRVYLNCANGLDEMRDSPGNSESEGSDDSDGLPPKKRRSGRDNDCDEGSSFGLLANTIHKFGEIYEKIEDSKRQQMAELEKMRMDFQRDLEVQRRQIIERAQAEIEKIQQGGDDDDDEEIDDSAENASG
ncbi:trihelix transcription factor ENAP1-like [Humulus lupulus]|uniref:trihelix transcription factor ENAP1-like n=1 Tax=Humulus lupulus TaxID=3486 RepID=UPI002B411F10|nr:trihelix transcription factor ENAP1-like [Humulus lupulus]